MIWELQYCLYCRKICLKRIIPEVSFYTKLFESYILSKLHKKTFNSLKKFEILTHD